MEAAHPAPPALAGTSLSKPRISASPWLVLVVLALGEYMILLDMTIVNVSIPSMSSDFKAPLDQLLWVLNAYTLVFAVLLITSGRVGDMLGHKKLFLSGLALFTLASAACSLSQNSGQLIAARVVQAVGAAVLMPQTLSIITSIFPPQKRGAAFGAWSAVAGLAAVTGPTLGGFLTSAFSWRAIFVPNLPIGIGAIVLAFLMMPELAIHEKRNLDLVGVVLATAGLGTLIFSVIEGQTYSWGRIKDVAGFDIGPVHAGLLSIPSLLFLSALLLVVFVLWEARQTEPLLPLALFADRNFSAGNVVGLVCNFAVIALFFLFMLFLQSVRNFSPLHAGLTLIPNALSVAAAAPISGRLTDKLNGKVVLFAGLCLLATGMVLIAHLASLGASSFTFLPALVVTGLGLGFTIAPMTSLAMRNIVPSSAGAASGFLNTTRQLGASLGTAVVGAVFATRLSVNLHKEAVHFAKQLPSQARAEFIKGFTSTSSSGLEVGRGQAASYVPHNAPASLAHQLDVLGALVFNTAFLDSFRTALLVTIPVLAIGGIATLLMRATPKAARAEAHGPAFPAAPPPAVPPAAARQGVPAAAGPVPAPAPVPAPVLSAPMGETGVVAVAMPIPVRAREGAAAQWIRPPVLSIVGGGGAQFPVVKPVTIGRKPGLDIVLDNPKVSRQHAQIHLRDGNVVIEDLNSANGTYVNGERVSRQHPIHDGDVVAIGDTAFMFRNAIERAQPRLAVMTGDRKEHAIGIGKPITIGRAAGNDIVINDPTVSRHHAIVSWDKGQIVIRDLETLNGTRVNGEPIIGSYPLHQGDVIAVGNAPLIFRTDIARQAAANPDQTALGPGRK